jgi:hypothetical protein
VVKQQDVLKGIWSESDKKNLTIAGLNLIQYTRVKHSLAKSKRLAFVITAGLALTGCCAGSARFIQPTSSALTRWDEVVHPAKTKNVKSAKARKQDETVASSGDSAQEAELAGLKPYSAEWWSLRDAIDRAAEVKLAKKLIICRDCMPSKPEDQTGSIAPN